MTFYIHEYDHDNLAQIPENTRPNGLCSCFPVIIMFLKRKIK